jgi:hypothetical protein
VFNLTGALFLAPQPGAPFALCLAPPAQGFFFPICSDSPTAFIDADRAFLGGQWASVSRSDIVVGILRYEPLHVMGLQPALHEARSPLRPTLRCGRFDDDHVLLRKLLCESLEKRAAHVDTSQPFELAVIPGDRLGEGAVDRRMTVWAALPSCSVRRAVKSAEDPGSSASTSSASRSARARAMANTWLRE